jgi:cytochrome c oxidase subunit 3
MKAKAPDIDVAALPTHAAGASNPLWWGTLAFVLIEGLGFVFGVAVYLYLYSQNLTWPLAGKPPGLFWSTMLTLVMLLSEIPNWWLKRAATNHDLFRVRMGIILMAIIGIVTIVIRAFEFTTLNVWWDQDAYGSIVWFMIGLHTTHLLTDVGETIVIVVLLFLGPVDLRRFSEVNDNQDYWDFVVVTWLVVYVTLYWLPRWLEVRI